MIPDDTSGEALDPIEAESTGELDAALEAVVQSLGDTPADETDSEPEPEALVAEDSPEAAESTDEPVEEPEAQVEDAEEQVEDAEEPEAQAEVPDATETTIEVVPTPRRSGVAWWPFIVYAVLWAGLLGASYVMLTGAQTEMPAFRQDAYPYLVLAGLVLTLLGPVMSLAIWLFSWFRAGKGERGGLLTAALIRGALVTFLGVALWWGMLVLVDALRLGLV